MGRWFSEWRLGCTVVGDIHSVPSVVQRWFGYGYVSLPKECNGQLLTAPRFCLPSASCGLPLQIPCIPHVFTKNEAESQSRKGRQVRLLIYVGCTVASPPGGCESHLYQFEWVLQWFSLLSTTEKPVQIRDLQTLRDQEQVCTIPKITYPHPALSKTGHSIFLNFASSRIIVYPAPTNQHSAKQSSMIVNLALDIPIPFETQFGSVCYIVLIHPNSK